LVLFLIFIHLILLVLLIYGLYWRLFLAVAWLGPVLFIANRIFLRRVGFAPAGLLLFQFRLGALGSGG
jgi:hypothetical protein